MNNNFQQQQQLPYQVPTAPPPLMTPQPLGQQPQQTISQGQQLAQFQQQQQMQQLQQQQYQQYYQQIQQQQLLQQTTGQQNQEQYNSEAQQQAYKNLQGLSVQQKQDNNNTNNNISGKNNKQQQQEKKDNKSKKDGDKQQQQQEKCDLHPKTFSRSCRKCKKIQESSNYVKNNQDDDYVLYENIKIVGKEDNIFKMAGNSASHGMNPRLKNSILSNEYFKNLYNLKTFHEVIDEIQKTCTHAQPWAIGSVGIPSSFFCCLMKFMTMRLTVKQVKNLIDYKLNPMVRLAGFLYIRYVCDLEYLWAWLRKYLLDEELCSPLIDQTYTMPVGEFVEKLLMDQDYYMTRLPRIPIKIDNKIKAKLLITQEKRDRKKKNIEQFQRFQKDVRVRAISRIDEEWHRGTVAQTSGNGVIVSFQDERMQGRSNFAGGDELVNLGEIELEDEDDIKTKFQYSNPQSSYLPPIPQQEAQKMPQSRSGSRSRSRSNHRHHSKKHRKHSRSRSYSSRSRSDSHKRKKKKHSSKRNKKDSKRRRHSRSYSSSRSSSRDRRKRNKQHNSPQRLESNKEREQRLIEEFKKRQAEKSVAYSKAEVARVPSSYKTALSGSLTSNVLYKKDRYSASPRRNTKFVELQKPEEIVKKESVKAPSGPSEKFLEQQAKLQQRYGGQQQGNSSKNRDYA